MTPSVPAMDVVAWLMDGDPAIRWQVMQDLLDEPADDVAAERARVEREGWGAGLLSHQDPEGTWAGGACFPGGWDWDADADRPGQPWTATLHVLDLLERLGLPASSEAARRTRDGLLAHGRWEHDGQAYFDGEVEPCINGRTVRAGTWLGVDVSGIVDRLLDGRLPDGGWNCDDDSSVSSFDTTINVVQGLVAHERAVGADPAVRAAREAGEEYLLVRSLFRGRRSGEVADPLFLELVFPHHWRHDVLWGLEHLREAGRPDVRAADAVEHVRSRRGDDGRWVLARRHPGDRWFDMEEVGRPSRWLTLRAMRVLRWWDAA